MAEYTVVVKVTAGYLVKIDASSPEAAADAVREMTLRDVQTEQFFVNTDRRIGNVWDEDGHVVLQEEEE